MALPRLLIAANRGYLRLETVAHLARAGFEVIAVASGEVSRSQLQALGVETLSPPLPQWPVRPDKLGRLADFTMPANWREALKRCDTLIYSPEPAESWQAFAPRYFPLTWVTLELETAAFEAQVPRMICLSGGKSLDCERYDIEEEWDGISFKERINDYYEYQRGTHLIESTIQHLYLIYLKKRQYSGFWGFLAQPPVTELIWQYPEYQTDPGRERTYTATEPLSAVQVSRYKIKRNYHTDRQAERWPGHSQLQALERLCKE
ncbi:MAG: hypothetical protein ACAI44_40045 [Candidatus Sericytochromatia bacterium]